MGHKDTGNQHIKTGLKITAAFIAGLSVMYAGHTHFNTTNDLKNQTVLSQINSPAPHVKYMEEPEAEKTADLKVNIKRFYSIPPSQIGSYLSARSAQKQQDWDNAYKYFNQARLMEKSAAGFETGLDERTFLISIISGNMEEAIAIANDIVARDGGELAYIVKGIDLYQKGNFKTAEDTFALIDTEKFGGYAVPILQAWSATAQNDIARAVEYLHNSPFAGDAAYVFQQALIYDYAGMADKAEQAYRLSLRGGIDLRETLFAANFFERTGDLKMAEKIYRLMDKREPGNAYTQNALNRIETAPTTDKSISDPQIGMGFTLFTMARLLNGKQAYDSAFIYGRIAEHIGYNSEEHQILMGNLMLHNNNYDQAIEYYDHVKSDDLLYKTAQIQKMRTWRAAGEMDKALDILEEWQQNDNYRIEALTQKGDLFSQMQKYALAAEAYDQAITALGDTFGQDDWRLLYMRGMMNERLDNWESAEKDLLQALEYSPNSPAVLNFLGYSWVDRDINLVQGMDLIERAISLSPNDGYIMDSYGWAFYKMGHFDEAVAWLEKALEYNPSDVTMIDHLGDAYWQSNRYQEARFQWLRALDMTEDQDEIAALERKLDKGLASISQHNKTDSATAENLTNQMVQ